MLSGPKMPSWAASGSMSHSQCRAALPSRIGSRSSANVATPTGVLHVAAFESGTFGVTEMSA